MTDIQMFAFESDFVASLRCVPMAVRLKLDLCGIKVSLRQWSQFTRGDRHDLLVRPCGTAPEATVYREALIALIVLRTGEIAKPLVETPCGRWDDALSVPAVVTDFARSLGLSPPNRSEWSSLSRLQRFALIKLTRDNHDNVNFVPAMAEFGLAGAEGLKKRDRPLSAVR